MIIVIEGPDGAGKSTLVDYLIENYNLDMKHSSAYTKNDLDYHLDLLEEDNVVLDRANLGEIVYPSVYGREPKMDWDDQIDFMNECADRNILYIIFYSSDFEVLRKRLFKRGDTEEVLKNAEKINLVFKVLANEFSTFYDNVFALDISKEKDQIAFFEKVKEEYNNLLENSKEEEE